MAYETDVNGLIDIPVLIKHGGEAKLECKLDIDFYDQHDGRPLTVGDVKKTILQQQVKPVPDSMRLNPDDCCMLLKPCSGSSSQEMGNDDLMRKYTMPLAKDVASLIIVDAVNPTLIVTDKK